MIRQFTSLLVIALILTMTTTSMAQRGQGRGRGFGRGGMGRGGMEQEHQGHAQDDRFEQDRDDFQFLLANHEKITRKVKMLDDGVVTTTESEDEDVIARIQEHVEWMQYRIEENHPIRMRDPLFAELFQHTDKIKMIVEKTEKGVKVTETSDDAEVAVLIQEHARTVSKFVANGFSEAMKNHPVPSKNSGAQEGFTNPKIKGHGEVMRLPSATQQPREGTKIVVDLTSGGAPDKLNPGVAKVARFVNIYAGAGEKPASLNLAIVLHGDATLTVLNDDAYKSKFEVEKNPNLELLHELHEAGVEIYVCGQSLAHKKAKPSDVVVFADVAVSALTSLANLQSDDYRYLPLGN